MNMRYMLAGLASGLFLSGAAIAGSTELIVNGSFEQPAIAAGTFQQVSSIPGWSGSAGVEIQTNNLLGAGQGTSFGSQYVELNVETPSTLSQSVATVPGAQYLLAFYFADRPGTGANSVAVAVPGSGTKTYTAADTGSVSFKKFTQTFTATGSESVISFTPSTTSFQGEGSLLDNVSVVQSGTTASVPTPSAFLAGIAGLLGLASFQILRRTVKLMGV